MIKDFCGSSKCQEKERKMCHKISKRPGLQLWWYFAASPDNKMSLVLYEGGLLCFFFSPSSVHLLSKPSCFTPSPLKTIL